MRIKNKLVHGVGTNDSVTPTKDCGIYQVWKSLLQRCYKESFKLAHPTYKDCTLAEEWLSFTAFRDWVLTQDYKGKELDKDLLVEGNKHYSPETCVFIDRTTNMFLVERTASRGDLPLGVCGKGDKFQAQCSNPFKNTEHAFSHYSGYVGIYGSPAQAHKAWKQRKAMYSVTLASQQTDPRIQHALLNRYL